MSWKNVSSEERRADPNQPGADKLPAQSEKSLFYTQMYSTVTSNSVSGQMRTRSNCAGAVCAQFDLGLRCPYVP